LQGKTTSFHANGKEISVRFISYAERKKGQTKEKDGSGSS